MLKSKEDFPIFKSSPLKTFLEEAKNWEHKNPKSNKIALEDFLANIRISNNEENKFPTHEEIVEIYSKLYYQSTISQNISKKKWSKEERKFLIWTVYYYSRIKQKKIEEIVNLSIFLD